MKFRKKNLTIGLMIFLVCSCDINNLNQPALGKLDESKLANKTGVEALLIGAYSLLDGVSIDDVHFIGGNGNSPSNWIYGSICGSEAYEGSQQTDIPEIRNIEKFKSIASNLFFDEKWTAIYAGVARTNTVLRVMTKATDISIEDQKRIAAEARFLRAFYHLEAVKLWNNVPFVDETITYDAGNYHPANDKSIWPNIENDFKFSFANLPAKATATGRANKYAAEAFLLKVYVFQHKFQEAQLLIPDLINNGSTANGLKYALLKNYADNFNIETKNREESVFAAQMSVNDGADYTDPGGNVGGGFNGNFADELNFPSGNNSVTLCCGFFQPSQWLVNHFKTDPVTGLPDLDNFNTVDVKNDGGILSRTAFTPYDGTLDPRLDWTVGRRGIPYLDWADHPGADWIRDQNYSGPYSPKKNVFYKSQVGIYTNTSGWPPMASANNVNLIRFSDILLWAAEVEIESGDLNKAREYVNQVRRRAADPSTWLKKSDGTVAANYKIGEYTNPWNDKTYARKVLRYERMLELGMEGHRFFDLVRWGIADTEINAYLQKEKMTRTYLNDAIFKKGINEIFPIPQRQIDLSAGADGTRKMIQNPGY
ncbi:MAG: RagB/SusD family nutrient uptake outer membrane protein [Saprospiraceae bacterium]